MPARDLFSHLPPDDPPPPAEPRVLSVSELTAGVKDLLGVHFAGVWVRGEIVDFARPQSGHCYFTLKDERAQLRAVLWRAQASRLRFDLHDGLEVVCQGDLDVYAPRGSYQLIVRQVEPQGLGGLQLAFRQLHARLAAEGLFDDARKRPLPRFPRRIAVVTSPTGAAIRDFLEVLRRRWPGVEVLIVPARVQGAEAPGELTAAVRLVNRLALPIDVLVLTRGGGSLEDLWAFNDEKLVRAVAASRIPVVSAVGHEIDVTLCDLAADVRALTPSEAAERVVPSRDEWAAVQATLARRLRRALQSRALDARRQLESLARRPVFRRPLDRLHLLARRLDELDGRLGRSLAARLEAARSAAGQVAAQLESLSPLAVLARGYSLTQTAAGRLVTSAGQVEVGEPLQVRLARGRLLTRVVESWPDDPSPAPE